MNFVNLIKISCKYEIEWKKIYDCKIIFLLKFRWGKFEFPNLVFPIA
jgi:hypothetical protein